MALDKIDVKTLLENKGLTLIDLAMLDPNNKNYRCLLMQPAGPIYANDNRIGHLDPVTGSEKCNQFVMTASARNVDLAIAPEYCTPWAVINDCICGNVFPDPGSIWALGAESLTPLDLLKFKEAIGGRCQLIHEEFSDRPAVGTYFDPIIFLFNAYGEDRLIVRVAIIQFKVAPSRDPHFLENQALLLGKKIYQFRNSDNLLSLAAIICSDSFALNDNLSLLSEITDRATLLHIQLNPDPRHKDYRAYRSSTFSGTEEMSNCDVICLNWAGGIVQYGDHGAEERWPNIGGSAWYIPLNRCSILDDEVNSNHGRGLYYTHLRRERRHALFLHYDEAVFELNVSKPLSIGYGVVANKIGPLLKIRYIWDPIIKCWADGGSTVDSGFKSLLITQEIKDALSELLPNSSPIDIERALVLSGGAAANSDKWYLPNKLDSCVIDSDEIVNRITFAQDQSEKAAEFRHSRLMRASNLAYLLATNKQWPRQISDVSSESKISWRKAIPHFNVHCATTAPALIVYLGESPSSSMVNGVVDSMFELLRKENGAHKHRLAVCYQHLQKLVFAPIRPLIRFDYTGQSRADITEPLEDIEIIAERKNG